MGSNKHWPSLFRSKPPSSDDQRQRGSSSLISAAVEERTPEPKPRWNPKPDQIRILESVFNSGMVNPCREEIRRIRHRLEEFGDVGDANVFYWFQNRKSRSKHKQRQLQRTAGMEAPPPPQNPPHPPPPVSYPLMTGHSSSSSSSDNSAHDQMGFSFFTNSPTASVNQQHHQAAYYQTTPNEFLSETYFYPEAPNASQAGFYFPDASASEFMGFNPSKRYDNAGINLDPQLGYGTVTSLPTSTVANTSHSLLPPASATVPSTIYHFQGLGLGDAGGGAGMGLQKITVFINDMEFEMPAGPFNVREMFGDEAVLVHSSGQFVITNEWGVTLQPLQHGAFYYLVE